jgi:hypothetical protein
VLLWHVHGGWTDAFVRGDHEYLLPVNDARDGWGLGRAGRPWPDTVREVPLTELHDEPVDLVVLQRTGERELAERLLGRRLGRDVAAVFLEHNTPKTSAVEAVHPFAGQHEIPIVHVTHFNRLVWDNGEAPTTVIEHGIPDPGELYTGERAELAVVANEPVRRWRVTGTDLLPGFAAAVPLRVFGMKTDLLPDALRLPDGRLTIGGDLPPDDLHAQMAMCRAYLHPIRWTSLGLSLLEAMMLGMPVLALATTEAMRAVPPEAGAISTDPDDLVRSAVRLIDDPAAARESGRVARHYALQHYGLPAFLERWDDVIADQVERVAARRTRSTVAAAHTTKGACR